MATSRAVMSGGEEQPVAATRVQISDDCLEIDSLSASDVMTLRMWVGRINGSTNIQPYLVEERPGAFKLYVGAAAERVRTSKGVQ
jgi:hypothetical protein